jgi:AcrR family transcriptional regulator
VKVARAETEERTRTALLDAAERLFFERGWEGTSLGAVATDAGVTKQTLLRHFGSKDGLLEHAFARAYDEVRDQRWDVPGDDVEHAVDNLLDHYEAAGDRALKTDKFEDVLRLGQGRAGGREVHRTHQRTRVQTRPMTSKSAPVAVRARRPRRDPPLRGAGDLEVLTDEDVVRSAGVRDEMDGVRAVAQLLDGTFLRERRRAWRRPMRGGLRCREVRRPDHIGSPQAVHGVKAT